MSSERRGTELGVRVEPDQPTGSEVAPREPSPTIIAYGTPEWYAARCGKVTASRIADLTARTKSGWGASRANYMAELIAERMTGDPATGYTSPAMQWGIDTEPRAIVAYSWHTNAEVEDIGYVEHPSIAMAGASPDKGVIGAPGLVEVKCPNTATHIDTLLSGTIPERYIKQMHWQMACTGRSWCDFVSYDPRMPDRHSLFVKRLRRDEREIKLLEHAVREFIQELESKIEALDRRPDLVAQLKGSLEAA